MGERKERLLPRSGDKYRVQEEDSDASLTHGELPTSEPARLREEQRPDNLLYAFVARGGVVLAEACLEGVNSAMLVEAKGVGAKFLHKAVPPGWDDHRDYFGKSKIKGTRLGVHTSSEPGLQFAVMYDAGVPKTNALKFLEKVVLLSNPLHETEWAPGAATHLCAQTSFGAILKQQLALFTSREAEMEKIRRVHQQVDEVKGILVQNVEKVLERGERLDELTDKSESLEQSASMFKKGATKLKRWHIMNQAKWGIAAGTAVTASVAIPVAILVAL